MVKLPCSFGAKGGQSHNFIFCVHVAINDCSYFNDGYQRLISLFDIICICYVYIYIFICIYIYIYYTCLPVVSPSPNISGWRRSLPDGSAHPRLRRNHGPILVPGRSWWRWNKSSPGDIGRSNTELMGGIWRYREICYIIHLRYHIYIYILHIYIYYIYIYIYYMYILYMMVFEMNLLDWLRSKYLKNKSKKQQQLI